MVLWISYFPQGNHTNIAQYCGGVPGKKCITVVVTASSEENGSSGGDTGGTQTHLQRQRPLL